MSHVAPLTSAESRDEIEVGAQRTRPALSEDWIAVLIGALMIGAVLLGLRPGALRFAWQNGGELTGRVLAPDNLARSIQLGLLLLVPCAAGAILLGRRLASFLLGFPALYALGWTSQLLAGQSTLTAWGLEYVIFALGIGLIAGRSPSLRGWFGEVAQAEFYIKIGLVVMGAGVLFSELVQAGLLGIAQALVVVVSVWFFCFWLARKLGVDDELGAMLASAVSICGVSAAIAACGAIQGDRRKLSYVTSLVLVVAVPMLIVMPWLARVWGLPPAVAGAWLGGTLDTSAAVVAAGELVGGQARNAAVVVKLSQNVLIGVAAFLLTVWWTLRNDAEKKSTVSAAVIWERFPKFVLGFLIVSFVFSFAVPQATMTSTRGVLTALRTALFALAFVSIGIETSLGDLASAGGGRPAMAFLGGQAFNVVVTLILAYLLFGGVLFAPPQFN